MSLISDKPVPVAIRFGVITLGDGNEYQVARAGFGERGQAMLAACDGLARADTLVEKSRHAVELFVRAMGAFYSDERIEALVTSEAFGMEHVPELIDAVLGNTPAGSSGYQSDSKKNSSTVS